jgi:hypothetical protein
MTNFDAKPRFQNACFTRGLPDFEIEYKINEWPKNSENLDLRSLFNILSGKNIKTIYFKPYLSMKIISLIWPLFKS